MKPGLFRKHALKRTDELPFVCLLASNPSVPISGTDALHQKLTSVFRHNSELAPRYRDGHPGTKRIVIEIRV